MTQNFRIPLTWTDLLPSADTEPEEDAYMMDPVNAVDVQDADRVIDQMVANASEPSFIFDSVAFDQLYSMCEQFQKLPGPTQLKVWNLVSTGMENHRVKIERIFAANEDASQDHLSGEEKTELSVCTSMYVFLGSWLFSSLEAILSQRDSAGRTTVVSTTDAKGKGGKAARSRRVAAMAIEGEDAVAEEVWAERRLLLSTVTHALLTLPLRRLFGAGGVGDEFSNCIGKAVFRILERKENIRSMSSTGQNQKAKCLEILGVLIRDYGYTFHVGVIVTSTMLRQEHLAPIFAELMSNMVKLYNYPEAVTEILAKVGKMDGLEVHQDSEAGKSMRTFLVSVAEAVPETTRHAIVHLLPHLDGPNHYMREAVLGILGHVISKVLIHDHGENDEGAKQNRDNFLDILYARIYDRNNYVRAFVLQVWMNLAQKRAIPIPHFKKLVARVLNRFQDTSGHVRKYAMQCLCELVRNNPFRDFFDLPQITKEKDEAQSLYKKMEATIGTEIFSADDDAEDKEPADEDALRDKLSQIQLQSGEGTESKESYNPEEILQMRFKAQYLADCEKFAIRITESAEILCKLLNSKTSSDVLEAMKVLVLLRHVGISAADRGIKTMLGLIWSKESGIREAVVDCYKNVYLRALVRGEDAGPVPKGVIMTVVASLIQLTEGCNSGELASLEELIGTLSKQKFLGTGVEMALWEVFAGRVPSTTGQHQIGAVTLLSMMANAKPTIAAANYNELVEVGITGQAKQGLPDLKLVKATSQLLAKMSPAFIEPLLNKLTMTGEEIENKEVLEEMRRLSPTNDLFEGCQEILLAHLRLREYSAGFKLDWYPMAEQVINMLYVLADQPDVVVEKLLFAITEIIFAPEDGHLDSAALTVFCALIGHVALQQIIHMERVEAQMKKLNAEKASKQKKEVKTKKGRSTIEEEMGLNVAAVDDAEAEYILSVCEREIVGDRASGAMLGPFGRLLVTICSQSSAFPDEMLRAAAVSALIKFMSVSSVYCEEHLRLVFTLLDRDPSPLVRANVVLGLGDLNLRFPNVIEPYNTIIFKRLEDPDVRVRHNSIMVLTHLILNGMIKGKGQMGLLAMCIVDKDSRISQMAKMFFFSKSQQAANEIYNILPDIISSLFERGFDTGEGLHEHAVSERFFTVMGYLFEFIKRERQSEALVEKMCQRFRTTNVTRHHVAMAYCLSQLTYNEKALKKLVEYFDCYKDILHLSVGLAYFDKIIRTSLAQIRVGGTRGRPEFKLAIDELQTKLNLYVDRKNVEQVEGMASDGSPTDADKENTEEEASAMNTEETNTATENEAETASEVRTRRSSRRAVESEKNKPAKLAPSRRSRRSRAVVEESDGEDDIEDDTRSEHLSETATPKTAASAIEDEEEAAPKRTSRRRRRGALQQIDNGIF
eukprot:Clim_evm4s23 gene=Clim_evmTU4s23